MKSSFTDQRGVMYFTNYETTMKQQIISINKKNVLRGIHVSPYEKIVTCVSGSFIDYVVDFTNKSATKYHLLAGNSLKIPANMGHLFISLEDSSTMLYYLAGEFDSSIEQTIHYRDPKVVNFLEISWDISYVLSEKDDSKTWNCIDYVILGANGFLGSRTKKVLEDQGKKIMTLNTRLEDFVLLERQLLFYKPKYLINCTGISGKPTTMWCEDNKEETVYTNLTLQLQLCHLCDKLKIHLTIYGSGLVYEFTDKAVEIKETTRKSYDLPLYYSRVRVLLEDAISCYSNILYLRIMYPISNDDHPKCFLTKMKSRTPHKKTMSVTILPELLPLLSNLIEKNITGIFNFVSKTPIYLPNINDYFSSNAKPDNLDNDTSCDEYLILSTMKLDSIK